MPESHKKEKEVIPVGSANGVVITGVALLWSEDTARDPPQQQLLSGQQPPPLSLLPLSFHWAWGG